MLAVVLWIVLKFFMKKKIDFLTALINAWLILSALLIVAGVIALGVLNTATLPIDPDTTALVLLTGGYGAVSKSLDALDIDLDKDLWGRIIKRGKSHIKRRRARAGRRTR